MDFFMLFERFIADSQKGRRRASNGKRLSDGTTNNYLITLKLLKLFAESTAFDLRVRTLRNLRTREFKVEQNYWKRFYRAFTRFLYNTRNCHDNYVGLHIRIIRTFFNYLNTELLLGVGEFYKKFYVPYHVVSIFPLMPEELNFLIFDQHFEGGLDRRMRETKDIFVFGCTVALRLSDLRSLNRSNLRTVNGRVYLTVRSKKTSIETRLQLPEYALAILQRYRNSARLLPIVSKSNLNKRIKQLLALAGFTSPVCKPNQKQGQVVAVKGNNDDLAMPTRFCDVASSHTMRRTAITSMLCLGAPEQVVRRISGHSTGSREFYKYVSWSQAFQDQTTTAIFEHLKALKLQMA